MCFRALLKMFKLEVFLSSKEGTSLFRISKHSFKCARLKVQIQISNYEFTVRSTARATVAPDPISVLSVHNF